MKECSLLCVFLGSGHAATEALLVHGVAVGLVCQVINLYRQVSNALQGCGRHSVPVQQDRVANLDQRILDVMCR